MSEEEQIRIERHELFDPEVDKALARERAGRERIVADTRPISPLRRVLLNPLIYLPLAAALAAFATWRLLDPYIEDFPQVGGEVELINTNPFDAPPGFVSMTIGSNEVFVSTDKVKLEAGSHGEAAFASVESIKVGDRVEAVGLVEQHRLIAAALRPSDDPTPRGTTDKPLWPLALLFPLTAALIAFGLLFVEGLTSRNYLRMIERSLLGTLLSTVFATLAFIPAGIIMLISQSVLKAELADHDAVVVTVKDISGTHFIIYVACRSAAWACIGAALGLGMNLVRSTKAQLRNSVIGGALGGALGGMFFDPIGRLFGSTMFTSGSASRLVGLLAVGLSIGLFVALVERLARDAWLRVRTGPLAGKSFILYKTPTVVGSAPSADVYLYKDAEIDAAHAAIHRVGTTYEIEDLSSRMGTQVGGSKVRRRRLSSGDQIVVGGTILDFEERQRRTPAA